MIKEKIRTIADHPQPGVQFRDITTLLKDPIGFRLVIDHFIQRYQSMGMVIDLVVGIEARGFIIGGALAYALGKGFVPIRKPGKLPAKVVSVSYELEYGADHLEMHEDAINHGDKILLIDDLLATGGTTLAAVSLIEKLGGSVVECAYIVNLPELGGDQQLQARDLAVYYLTEFAGS